MAAPPPAPPAYSKRLKPGLLASSCAATENAALAPVVLDCNVRRSPVWSRSTVAVTPAFAALILAATLASVSSSDVISTDTVAGRPLTSLALSVAPSHSPKVIVSVPSPKASSLATTPDAMVCADASCCTLTS
ncbi:hypothetical protein D3C86_1642490 [compost metagenome]